MPSSDQLREKLGLGPGQNLYLEINVPMHNATEKCQSLIYKTSRYN